MAIVSCLTITGGSVFDPSHQKGTTGSAINDVTCHMQTKLFMVFMNRLARDMALHLDPDRDAWGCSSDVKSAFQNLWIASNVLRFMVIHVGDLAFIMVSGPFGVATLPKGWVSIISAVFLSLRISFPLLYRISLVYVVWPGISSEKRHPMC